jgi:hypothetical protein
MARLDNSIGEFDFGGISGNPLPPSEFLSIDQRPGLDGTEITREAVKGLPFTLVTWVDEASYEAAWGLYRDYLALKQGDPVPLVHAGINSETVENYLVQVLDVRPLEVKACRPGAGGLNPPSLAMLICEWHLIAIEI